LPPECRQVAAAVIRIDVQTVPRGHFARAVHRTAGDRAALIVAVLDDRRRHAVAVGLTGTGRLVAARPHEAVVRLHRAPPVVTAGDDDVDLFPVVLADVADVEVAVRGI